MRAHLESTFREHFHRALSERAAALPESTFRVSLEALSESTLREHVQKAVSEGAESTFREHFRRELSE